MQPSISQNKQRLHVSELEEQSIVTYLWAGIDTEFMFNTACSIHMNYKRLLSMVDVWEEPSMQMQQMQQYEYWSAE